MNVKLISVENKGDLEKEAVWLDVVDDADIGNYALCDTTYTDEEAKRVSNRLRHFYWFPDRPVKKGDYVKLYTKVGKPTTWTNKRGTTTHVFYWGLMETVWNQDGDCAVLFQIADWSHFKA
jgi:hypothetical protein